MTGAAESASLPDDQSPLLAVVIDLEEEFDWSASRSRTDQSVESVPLQELIHKAVFRPRGLVPCYVVDYPVAIDATASRFLRGLLERGECEIGAHLHPWVNPPHDEELTAHSSFPGNLPPELECRKLEVLTEAIERAFGIRPRIYRAGRYGIGPATPAIIDELGYNVDLSLVPHTSYAADEGPNFRGLSDRARWIGPHGRILQLPVTRGFAGLGADLGPTVYPLLESSLGRRLRLPAISARLRLLERISLSPEGATAKELLRLGRALLRQGHRVFSLTYHGPSLGIGHTPYVRSEEDRERLIATVATFLDFFTGEAHGSLATISQIRAMFQVARASTTVDSEPGVRNFQPSAAC
jgi:hypothetical protein